MEIKEYITEIFYAWENDTNVAKLKNFHVRLKRYQIFHYLCKV